MGLSSGQLIQINATAIVGLLILYSFQIIPGSTLLPEKIETIFGETDKLELENVAIKNLLKNSCQIDPNSSNLDLMINSSDNPELNDMCNELLLEYFTIKEKLQVFQDRVDIYRDVIKNIDDDPRNFHLLLAKLFQNYLILPFIVSILIEFITSRKKNIPNLASKWGRILTFGGFILLAFVTVILSYFSTVGNLYSQ